MARFDYYEDDDFKDEDLFPDIDDDEIDEINMEYIKVLEKRELVEALRIQVMQKELNYVILRKAITYCEKSWFWKFKSAKTKLDLIISAYQTFKALVDIDLAGLDANEDEGEGEE